MTAKLVDLSQNWVQLCSSVVLGDWFNWLVHILGGEVALRDATIVGPTN